MESKKRTFIENKKKHLCLSNLNLFHSMSMQQNFVSIYMIKQMLNFTINFFLTNVIDPNHHTLNKITEIE